ncbi:unnamed protein product [Prunus armeniaca]
MVVVVVVVKKIKVKVVVVRMVEEELVEVEEEAVAVMLEVVVVCGGGVHLFDVCSYDGRAELPFTKLKREKPTLERQKEALEGFLNGQNCGLFSLKEAEVAGLEDY